jgi:transposase
MSFAIALSDEQWELVADLFDPPGRRGAPAVIRAARWSMRYCSSAGPTASGATCPSATAPGPRSGPNGGGGGRTARLAERRRLALDIKAPPPGTSSFVPIRPLYKIEHAFAQLGRWRPLSRCYEGTEASARAWLEVASVGYLAWRAVT